MDFAKSWEPYWTNLLNDFLESKYSIYGGAIGWPNQVEIYAKSNGLEWTKAFKTLMLELIQESNVITFTVELQELNKTLSKREVKSV